jgi:replicative DNA helicase
MKRERAERVERAAPQWNEDAEQSVLSAIFMDNKAADAARTMLHPEHFYSGAHRRIYEAMCTLLDRGAVVDPLTVSHALAEASQLEAVGGKDYLGFLIDAVPTAANIEYHAKIVREIADRRALVSQLEETAKALRAGDVGLRDAATDLQSKLLPIAVESKWKGFVHVKDDLWPMMEDLETRMKADSDRHAIPTGFPEIDGPLGGGPQRGELVFLCGVPGGLKTATAMNIALNVVRDSEHRIGAAIVSAEMSRRKLHQRNIARLAMVDFTLIRKAELHDTDFSRLAMAAGMMSHMPLWVDETPRPVVGETIAKCRHLKSKHPEIGLFVVDFIQQMQRLLQATKHDNRALDLTDISYQLAAAGKELDALFIATCQVDAAIVDGREDKRPRLQDMRWSQGMREAGDLIGLCYRDKTYNPEAPDTLELNFAKARDAEPFIVTLNWIGRHMHLDSPKRRALGR